MEKCCCSHKIKTKIRSNDEKKQLISRINRINGQLNGIKKMIEDNRYCDDILIQLSAADQSIKSLANLILDKHMHSCLVNDIKEGKIETIDEIINLIKRFQ